MKKLLKIFWYIIRGSLKRYFRSHDDEKCVKTTHVLGEISKLSGAKRKVTRLKTKND